MKLPTTVTVAVAASLVCSTLSANEIKGRGASFPAPLYKVWTSNYFSETGKKVNYTPTGSGDGIKSIKKRMVDFAGSDKPLKPKSLKKNQLAMFPTVVGSIVLAYNLDGIKDGELKLSRAAIDAIFSGKATFWDDAVIAKSNDSVKLPHEPITVCVRADKSGTTYNFTYFLNKINPDVKVSKKPKWQAAKVVAGKSNSGVTANIQQIKGAIGYIEYSYKEKLGLAAAQIENRSGKFIVPTVPAFQEAAKYASWSAQNDFYALIGDPEGEGSYPIVAATFILLPEEKTQSNKEVVSFFEWALTKGDKAATTLGYVPLPASTKEQIFQYWKAKGMQ